MEARSFVNCVMKYVAFQLNCGPTFSNCIIFHNSTGLKHENIRNLNE